MDGDDIGQLIMLGSDEFLQIWAATHGSEVPQPAPVGQVMLPGVQARFNTNLLIVGLIIVAAIIVLK